MAKKTKRETAGFEKLGVAYVKTYSRRTIASDGSEVALAAKIIPPYVQPRYYWLSARLIGDGGGVVPDAGAYWNIRSAIMPVDPRITQVETDDVTGDEFVGRYMEPSDGAYPDTSDAAVSDIGIPGDEPTIRSDYYKQREIMRYRSYLGLPDKAVFNNADLILYTDHLKRRGKIRERWPIDSTKFFGVAANVDVPTLSTDWGDIMWGNQLTVAGLADMIISEFAKFNSSGRAIDVASHDADFLCYLTQGFGAAIDVDQQVHIRVQCTLMCDVYAPKSANVITIS